MIALFLHDATMLPVDAPKSMIAFFLWLSAKKPPSYGQINPRRRLN
jgi:hypothetical protein